MTKSIMIQGTGSNVGKSMLVAGIARALMQRGMSVAPFKPQNMSNNAAVTIDGGEIGRAQALQALACGREPHTDMNPVLLKPESEIGSQVVVQGKRLTTVKARDYAALKPRLMPSVLESFNRIAARADIVLVEGAGSPAEVNLRAGDIANIGFATAAEVPVVLAGDIDRGGVIAQIVGTHTVLPPADRALIRAVMINKFRGDPTLFDEGVSAITSLTNWPCLGVIPWFADAHKLPAEDAYDIRSSGSGAFKIAVPQLSRIANFDDLDPLKSEPNVAVEMVPPGSALPGDADLIIIPGSKSTTGDLKFLRAQGWDIDIYAHVRRGGKVLGICGGYQMLGRKISDPDGIEGAAQTIDGLGLLNVETKMTGDKTLSRVTGHHMATGQSIAGYEIHIGRTSGPDCSRPWISIKERSEGASSADGKIQGTYLHGIFTGDSFRAAYLTSYGVATGHTNYGMSVETTLDRLACHLETALDLDQFLSIAAKGI